MKEEISQVIAIPIKVSNSVVPFNIGINTPMASLKV
jgi:hypothetical protein